MDDLALRAAFGDYDHVAALRTRSVVPRGIELSVDTLSPSDIFLRMCESLEFDVSEMSMGAHAFLCGAGESPFLGIPAFPSRAFRHAMVYANVDASIDTPEDLNGKCSRSGGMYRRGRDLLHRPFADPIRTAGNLPDSLVLLRKAPNSPGRIRRRNIRRCNVPKMIAGYQRGGGDSEA